MYYHVFMLDNYLSEAEEILERYHIIEEKYRYKTKKIGEMKELYVKITDLRQFSMDLHKSIIIEYLDQLKEVEIIIDNGD